MSYILGFGALVAIAVGIWWMWSGSSGNTFQRRVDNAGRSFRLVRVIASEHAVWTAEHAVGRFGELGRVSRVDASTGTVEQHVWNTRVELLDIAGKSAVLSLGGGLHLLPTNSAEALPVERGLSFVGVAIEQDLLLERSDRSRLYMDPDTLQTREAGEEDSVRTGAPACRNGPEARIGDRVLSLVDTGRGRHELRLDGARAAGPFLDATFLFDGHTASPLAFGSRAVVSRTLPDQGRALVVVDSRDGSLREYSAEQLLPGADWRIRAIRGCRGALIVAEAQLKDEPNARATAFLLFDSNSGELVRAQLLSDQTARLHPL